jgi:ankyrin repeat protein
MQDLPLELIGNILDFILWGFFVIKNCRLINRRICNVVDDYVRPKIIIMTDELCNHKLLGKYSKAMIFSLVEVLDASHLTIKFDKLFDYFENSHLETIILPFCCTDTIFLPLVTKFPKLSVIDVSETNMSITYEHLVSVCIDPTNNDIFQLNLPQPITFVDTKALTDVDFSNKSEEDKLEQIKLLHKLKIPFRQEILTEMFFQRLESCVNFVLTRVIYLRDIIFSDTRYMRNFFVLNHDMLFWRVFEALVNMGLYVGPSRYMANNGSFLHNLIVRDELLGRWSFLLDHYDRELINCKNELGRTPLHEALIRRDLSIISMLLERGADIHALDNNGNSSLHFFLMKLSGDKIPEFLTISEFITHCNKDGLCPIHLAILAWPVSVLEKMVLLGARLDCKANLKHYAGSDRSMVKFYRRFNPMHYKTEKTHLFEPIHLLLLHRKTDLKTLKWALVQQKERYSDLSFIDDMGRHIVHFMHFLPELEIYNRVCHKTFDQYATMTDHQNRNILCFAMNAAYRNEKFCKVHTPQSLHKMVSTVGMNWEQRDIDGMTPLLFALKRRNAKLAITILRHVKHIEPDCLGNTAIHYVAANTVSYLNSRWTYHGQYSVTKANKLVKILMDRQVDPVAKNNNGYTAIHYLESSVTDFCIKDFQK